MLELIAGHRYILADGYVTGPLEDYGQGWTCEVMCHYWNYDGSHDTWDTRCIVAEYIPDCTSASELEISDVMCELGVTRSIALEWIERNDYAMGY